MSPSDDHHFLIFNAGCVGRRDRRRKANARAPVHLGKDATNDQHTVEAQMSRKYQVQAGDTLSAIAERFYGDATLFDLIAAECGGAKT